VSRFTFEGIATRWTNDFAIIFGISWRGLAAIVVIALVIYAFVFVLRRVVTGRGRRIIEVDQVELGIGSQKVRLKPNEVDRQVAYKLWVELSTRKIGLPIDFNHDVIFEIYDSWYNFFTVTREMIKDIPVSKLHRADTRKIIYLSIDVLNEGIRPHLTEWHARFRRWYEHTAESEDFATAPHEIRGKYPQYEQLKADMEKVNQRLMRYRDTMRQIIFGILA
jgi:hypothetical protein